MNIFEGLLWAVGIIVSIGVLFLLIYWVMKPIFDEDERNGNNNPDTPFRQDIPPSTESVLSCVKRATLLFIIVVALMLDSCDGKFLT